MSYRSSNWWVAPIDCVVTKAIQSWLNQIDVETLYIAPGSPWENGYAESFHSRLRDEFLALEEFESLAAARKLTTAWQEDYNHHRPHSFRSEVAFGYASSNFSAPAVQRSYPNLNLHSKWYRNLRLDISGWRGNFDDLIRLSAVFRGAMFVGHVLTRLFGVIGQCEKCPHSRAGVFTTNLPQDWHSGKQSRAVSIGHQMEPPPTNDNLFGGPIGVLTPIGFAEISPPRRIERCDYLRGEVPCSG